MGYWYTGVLVPKVVVYLRADEFRDLEERVGDPAAWVRGVVRGAVLDADGNGSVERAAVAVETDLPAPAFVPVTAKSEKVVKCEAQHHMAPSLKCSFELGHEGNHSWKD